MNALERRNKILQRLSSADVAISATALAREFSVTRQVIVGDIALLRAQGHDISATPRGYVIPAAAIGPVHQIACIHSEDQTQAELNAIVDCGCTVLDVIVEHPVYGQLTAPLQISSRYDVEQFLQKMHDAAPLSALTEGIHLHTISCPNEDVFAHLKEMLHHLGILLAE